MFSDDTQRNEHILSVSPAARWLWAASIMANRGYKDGRSPFIRLSRALALVREQGCTEDHIEELVKAGRWEPAPDGWNIHDFKDFLPRTARTTFDSDSGRTAGRRSAAVRREKYGSAVPISAPRELETPNGSEPATERARSASVRSNGPEPPARGAPSPLPNQGSSSQEPLGNNPPRERGQVREAEAAKLPPKLPPSPFVGAVIQAWIECSPGASFSTKDVQFAERIEHDFPRVTVEALATKIIEVSRVAIEERREPPKSLRYFENWCREENARLAEQGVAPPGSRGSTRVDTGFTALGGALPPVVSGGAPTPRQEARCQVCGDLASVWNDRGKWCPDHAPVERVTA